MSDERYNLHDVQWPDVPFQLLGHAVLLGKRGSEAHGTYLPPTDPNAIDDRDIMGACIPPIDHYFGLKSWSGADSIKGCWDVVLYSFQKFVRLLMAQNPNVICMLWLRETDYLHLSPEGEELLEHRELFRSRRRAYESFVGYAMSQLKRMTHFQAYRGYMGEKRKALVDKYGWDTKNASHLIRLLRMGSEYLTTGQLRVYREDDRDYLLAVKRGQIPLEEVKFVADGLFKKTRDAYEKSPIPEAIDEEEINRLTLALTDRFFRRTLDSEAE